MDQISEWCLNLHDGKRRPRGKTAAHKCMTTRETKDREKVPSREQLKNTKQKTKR